MEIGLMNDISAGFFIAIIIIIILFVVLCYLKKHPLEEDNIDLVAYKGVIKIECPYCHSKCTSKITTTAKVTNVVLFGIFGTKRFRQWHCNNCGSDF